MTQILTFLGKGGTARTKCAIAAAKLLASQGKRVLLAGLAEPELAILLGTTLAADPPRNRSQFTSSAVSNICTVRTQLGGSEKT